MSNLLEKMKVFFGFVEEEEGEIAPLSEEKNAKNTFKGTLINSQSAQPFLSSEIKVEEPRIYEDSLSIATYLRDNIPVVVNLKYLDTDASKRLIDFICGTAYAINGHMLKIGENIFLFTPANIMIAESNEKSTFEQGLEQEEKEMFFRKRAIS